MLFFKSKEDKNLNKFTKEISGILSKSYESDAGWNSFLSDFSSKKPYKTVPKRYGKQLLETYQGWNYIAVQKKSESVSNATFYLRDKKTGERIENHLIIDILDKPNKDNTLADILELSEIHKSLIGESFLYLPKATNSENREIYTLRPDLVQIKRDTLGNIENYIYTANGKQSKIDPDEIVHLKLQNPLMDGRGYAPLQAGIYAYDVWEYMQQWNAEYFFNSAEPRGYLSSEQKLSGEMQKQLSNAWNKAYGGIANSQKTAILSGGLSYNKIQDSPREADFIKTQEGIRDFLLAIHGVPKALIGMTADYNKANVLGAKQIYLEQSVEPRLRKLVKDLNLKLLPLFSNTEGLELAYEPITEQDESEKVENTDKMRGFITINEARQRHGFDEISDGDTLLDKNEKVDPKDDTKKKDSEAQNHLAPHLVNRR